MVDRPPRLNSTGLLHQLSLSLTVPQMRQAMSSKIGAVGKAAVAHIAVERLLSRV